MSNVRDAILAGAGAASEFHDAFRVRDAVADGTRAIDVFEAIVDLAIPLQFAPLEGLLGACVRVNDAAVRILITSKRDLHLQRFTAAHELGHFLLQHEGSLDREVRMPGQTRGRDFREVEADAFAAEFLTPKWLMAAIAMRHGWWSVSQLSTPDIVYQLSLRLAVSYEATCWGLASQACIESRVAEKLIESPPKSSKLRALRGISLNNPWADVWCLDSKDDGALIDAGPNDLIVLTLDEQASAGYSWDTTSAQAVGSIPVSSIWPQWADLPAAVWCSEFHP
jgi:Zn-dependent peptidase ImmA (M78 family)